MYRAYLDSPIHVKCTQEPSEFESRASLAQDKTHHDSLNAGQTFYNPVFSDSHASQGNVTDRSTQACERNSVTTTEMRVPNISIELSRYPEL